MSKLTNTWFLSLVLIAFLAFSTNTKAQLVGDLNDDLVVDSSDLQILSWQWLSPGCMTPGCTADLDGINSVNMADLALLANNWQIVDPHIVISEFMASNASSEPLEEGELLDGNGESSDWIEIYNPTATAVDLGGWYLSNNDSNLTMWRFPSGVQINAGEFLIVFASGKNLEENPLNYPYLDIDGYYHTNFKLDQSGEYLAIVAPDGNTIVHKYSPEYPAQLTNVSFGLPHNATAVVSKNAIATYHVPKSGDAGLGTDWTNLTFDDSKWDTQPTTNLHFGAICGTKGINYEYFEGAWSYVPNFDGLTPIDTGVVQTFNITPRQQNDHFGFRFTGYIEVPLNGDYTFYTSSDDGSLLFINDTLVVSNDGRHGVQERSGIIYLNAGMHSITVEYFEYQGDESLSVKYEGPGIAKQTIPYDVLCSGTITNQMQGQMQFTNASLWARIEFEVEDPHVFDMLALRIRYEDGFVAYLNGQYLTKRNAPDLPLPWNSTALTNRPIEDSSVFEEINLMSYLHVLQNGNNVLAIQGLNDNKNDPEFRILPELITAMNRTVPQYFSTPTPGTFNIPGALGAVSDVWLSTERTFYTGPPDWHIDLTLSNGTDGAEIRYTDDGSLPTMTHGFTYNPVTDPPLEIDKTTIIRAVAVKPGWLDSKVETHTYLFLGDVVHQPLYPSGFPNNGWGHAGPDYEMDPNVIIYHGTSIKDDLKAVPTLSLAMDVNDWFGLDGQGIYPQGELSERAVSAEFILPDGSEGFQIDCAVMIVGGSSVYRWKMDKLSMRLKFKGEYGPTELRYPVFGQEATDEFDTLVLDARMNNSWGYGGGVLVRGTRPWIIGRSVNQRDVAQYTRDQFASDIHNAMGGYGTHGRHVHLYLNGLYWGLYWLHERPDEHFAASYFGGDDDDYDILKHNSSTVIHGTADNYSDLFQIASSGLGSNTQYQLIQQYLDVPDLINYMITNFYIGNTDWDHHNWYATFNHVDPYGRWRYHSWDAEHVMENLYEDVTGKNNSGCPSRLHQQLTQNDEYRLLFADHVHRHFFNDGVLTPEGAEALYSIRLREVDRAIVGESARWGDNQIDKYPNIRYMRDPHWLLERDWQLNNYIPERNGIVLEDLKSRGLYPDVNAPVFYINGSYQHGGPVLAGADLSIDNTNQSGNIYYTLDGSDPRQSVSG
ncbi:MAG: hypothetical protein GWO10_00070, partial [candidate division Zixibacteria bacterium]|nr:hypothetical protein [Gammaproteobacteria bacterium]NIR62208.1 hypothetical protein [candidate division Zixibacteria bacterium]NIS49927.1 hypothetical protein [Phycisphaerae bacterium]NIW43208.1 hypothetical protein [Gammaproteobacteria bacterium]NIW97110.1 hypothetical protein [Phycisphaerae bacterium]